MSSFLRFCFKSINFIALLFLTSPFAYGSHIYGVDLYYTSVSTSTYTINLVVYGDCSGAAFFTLASASPVIDIYNGNTYINSVSLTVQPPINGIEVTPVCPAQASNTQCTSLSNPLPGIKKFLYKTNVTLPGASSVWRFVFASGMGGSSTAGRSNSISNILITGSGSPIQLVDTLNNVGATNSNAIYTTIPTPFFCINVPANYNPGAVDADGDSLAFALVPGIDASTGGSVTYNWPYSATAPLSATAGTYSFSSTTGQLAFTPNIVQKALVVYNVEEFRGGVLRGTSQREMTVVVISPCTNNPPTGAISGISGGSLVSSTHLNICSSAGAFSFHINPTDADGDSITMTASGLPSGATFNIVNNGSTAPLGTFNWSTAGVTPGSYTFFITHQDHGCPLSSRQVLAYTITVLPTPTSAVSIISPATCIRRAAIQIVPGGTSSPWLINVLQASVTVHSYSGVTGTITDSLAPGTYTIRIYNADFCFKDTSITIVAPALPTGTVTISSPLCAGTSTGSINVIGATGLFPFQYALGSGSYSSTGSFTGLAPGVYTVHIKDANGCIKDTAITVNNPAPILVHLGVQKPLCNAQANGRVIVFASGSVPPYTYAMGTGSFIYTSNDTFSNLTAGTYSFHIMNANGCVKDTTITLVDSQYLHAALTITNILCYGGNATVTVSAMGGFGIPYSFAYNSGSFGASNVFAVSAGAYTFHVHDPQSCFFDTTVSIAQPLPVTITPIITNAACYGTATGSVIINVSGGTPGYQYAADGGSFGASSTITLLAAGAHILHVKDANNCVYSDTINITQPSPIVIDSVLFTMPSCNGGNNGSIRVFASGGVPSYTYAINAGTYGASNNFTSLSGITYTLHVKDANGCIRDTTVTLPQPTVIVPSAVVTEPLCATLGNGQVSISATGGTPGYTYARGAGTYSTSGTFTSLPAGVYVFHIKDNNGCIRDTSITLINATHISGNFIITPPLCNGDANGIVNVTGTGGSMPYTYALGSGSYGTSNVFNSLSAGSYIFHIEDANGCIGDTTVAITQPQNVGLSITITPPTCHGYNDGFVAASGTGGTPGFVYSFNGGPFTSSTMFTLLTAGIDSIKVKDTHGCDFDTTFTISQPTSVAVGSLTTSAITCNGGANGTITVTGAGGTPSYTYAANSSAYQVSSVLTGLASGTQVIHIKDSHGCIKDTSVTLSQPFPLRFTGADTVNPTCEDYKDGSVLLYVTGGSLPYHFSTDNFTFFNSPSFTGLAEGTYTFFIKDANGCTADTTITLTGYPHIVVNSVEIQNPLCAGNNNGLVAVVASGGNPPFTFAMTGVNNHVLFNVFDSLVFGTYTVTITDAKGCLRDTSVRLLEPDSLLIQGKVINNDCIGYDNQGIATALVYGGTEPYSFLWTPDSVRSSYISHMANGYYTVHVKDAHNCEDSATVRIGYEDCCTPYIPNAFSPNGDGKNDEFRVKYKGDIKIIEFSIYNRFGEHIFESNYSMRGWDGTYKGTQCEMGSYYYYIRIICGTEGDKVLEFQGDVTLIR